MTAFRRNPKTTCIAVYAASKRWQASLAGLKRPPPEPRRDNATWQGGVVGADQRADVAQHSTLASRTKALIVRLAVWGFIPADFATWFIQRGGLSDA